MVTIFFCIIYYPKLYQTPIASALPATNAIRERTEAPQLCIAIILIAAINALPFVTLKEVATMRLNGAEQNCKIVNVLLMIVNEILKASRILCHSVSFRGTSQSEIVLLHFDLEYDRLGSHAMRRGACSGKTVSPMVSARVFASR